MQFIDNKLHLRAPGINKKEYKTNSIKDAASLTYFYFWKVKKKWGETAPSEFTVSEFSLNLQQKRK